MIRLNCFLAVSADNKAAALEAARALTVCSLQQDGCVAYDTFVSATRPEVLMICETWRDQAALDAHSASAEFKRYVGELERLGQLKIEQFAF